MADQILGDVAVKSFLLLHGPTPTSGRAGVELMISTVNGDEFTLLFSGSAAAELRRVLNEKGAHDLTKLGARLEVHAIEGRVI